MIHSPNEDTDREKSRLLDRISELERTIKVLEAEKIELMLDLGWDKPVKDGCWKG